MAHPTGPTIRKTKINYAKLRALFLQAFEAAVVEYFVVEEGSNEQAAAAMAVDPANLRRIRRRHGKRRAA